MDNPVSTDEDLLEPGSDGAAVGRFTDIYRALGPGTRWWSDSAWLRFAAQAAIMRTSSPEDTARLIETYAEDLYRHAHWYDALASPVNLVVAATLVQTADTVAAFTAEVGSARQLLHSSGFHVGGSHLITTVLILRVLANGTPATKSIIDRMRQIYLQMQGKHWWLTGRSEVPVCALLAAVDGTPEQLSQAMEATYARLQSHHLTAGHDLLTAARILLLRGCPGSAATDRFLGIADVLASKAQPFFHGDYDGLALLCLLDHTPSDIVQRLNRMAETLADLPPLQFLDVNATIAADLVFLDLVRLDAQMHPFTQPEDQKRVDGLLRLQLAVSLLLVQVPSISAVEGGATRWHA